MVSQKNASDQGRWAFVTTSPTARRPTAAQRTLMRKHIMKDIGYSRRAYHTSSEPGSTTFSRATEESSNISENVEVPKALLSTATALVTFNNDSLCVLHHVFSDAFPSYLRVYREKWYPACVQDPAAFHQMIACCATHLYRWQPTIYQRLKRVAISEHAQALTIARERLTGVTHSISEDYLVVILMFACYAHLLNELETYTMHMEAIRKIFASRTNDISEEFMRLYQTIDSVGSYAFGTTTSSLISTATPLPALTHTTLENSLLILINSLDMDYSLLMLQAFQSLHDLNNHLTLVQINPGSSILDEPFKMDLLVEPVSRRFLSIRVLPDMPESISALLTYLRAGALLYLAEFRRRSGISPVMTTFQVDKLKKALRTVAEDFDIDPSIHLWFLTVGALESSTPDDQSYFCSRAMQLGSDLGIETISRYEDYLHRVIWFDPLFRSRLSALLPFE